MYHRILLNLPSPAVPYKRKTEQQVPHHDQIMNQVNWWVAPTYQCTGVQTPGQTKSAMIGVISSISSTFSGLISRWTKPCSWIAKIPSKVHRAIFIKRERSCEKMGVGAYWRITARRDPFEQNFIKIQPCVPTQRNEFRDMSSDKQLHERTQIGGATDSYQSCPTARFAPPARKGS